MTVPYRSISITGFEKNCSDLQWCRDVKIMSRFSKKLLILNHHSMADSVEVKHSLVENKRYVKIVSSFWKRSRIWSSQSMTVSSEMQLSPVENMQQYRVACAVRSYNYDGDAGTLLRFVKCT
ncbi:hypothetical protein POM88_003081 [Heracleum sosnowskyi]|uniref:Uncharacterized protein n=1 Tax=Heracleum sosnowskyi TaxID=360622 RepID=A0AAD8JGX1_9APIA|nr:hypothetical protein POM88_003081 [Heracleum sosnowskyi]